MDAAQLYAAAGGGSPTSIFHPVSSGAVSILALLVLTGAIFALIFAVVEGVLGYNLWRFRAPDAAAPASRAQPEPPQLYGSNPIELAWTVAPGVVVFFLVLAILRTLWEVKAEPPPLPKPGDGALVVRVLGRQWWWEYRYESYDGRPLNFTTANELHVPASTPGRPRTVYLILESDDVCHSFWVPRLAGKTDLIPGRTNHLSFTTSETGLFLGQCAEYCGTQHAHMLLRVFVDPPETFEAWLADEVAPAADDPAAERGRALFLSQSCVNCHRVRGTAAAGDFAPDLTHLMRRQTLASGMVSNTPENLARWVGNPQSIKPGCLMPAFGLDDRQRDDIVQYLLTLR